MLKKNNVLEMQLSSWSLGTIYRCLPYHEHPVTIPIPAAAPHDLLCPVLGYYRR